MSYSVKKERVAFDGNTVRGAHAATFEALLGGWGTDRAGVYFEGRKVPRCRRAHFRAFCERFGADDKNVFFRLEERAELVRSELRQELDLSDIRCLVTDGTLFVYSRDVVFVGGRWGLVGPYDGRSFQPLGQGYAVDAEQVYFLDEHGRAVKIAGAHRASFVVDAEGARDRDGRFVTGRRDNSVLPVQLETDLPRGVDERAMALWRLLLPRWFASFDAVLPNDDPAWNAPRQPDTATPIPEHRLTRHGFELELEAGGRRQRGKLSALELLAGWLFGIARGKITGGTVCIRLTVRADDVIVSSEGDPPPWQTTLELAFLLLRLGEVGEARLLTARVLAHYGRSRPAVDPRADPSATAQHLLPGLCAALPSEPSIPALRSLIDSLRAV